MRKFLKWIGIIIVAIFVLWMIIGIILINVIDPNRLKPIISQQVLKATGRTLTISGDLRWKIFPSIGFKVGQAELSNAKGFNNRPFATLDSATISIEVLPLIFGQIETDDLIINGLTINLMKNAVGQNNWTFTQTNTAQDTTTAAPDEKTDTKRKISLIIPQVEINHAILTWNNAQTKQMASVSNINLSIKNIQQRKAFPIKLSLVVDSQQPKIYGILNFNGKLRLKNLTTNTVDLLQCIDLQADLSISQLALGKLNIQQIQTPITISDSVINLSPITANIYGGDLNGNTNINWQSAQPKTTVQLTLQNTNFQPLMKDLVNNKNFKGTLNLQTQLNAVGFDTFVQTLNGNAKFNIKNGALTGIDIAHLIKLGHAIINKEPPPMQRGANETEFGNLMGTANIKNGIVTCNDFLLNSKTLQVDGHGNINLVLQRMDYTLNANLTGAPPENSIPILISGPFNDLSVGPNVMKLARNRVKQEINKQLDKHLDKNLKNIKDELFKNF